MPSPDEQGSNSDSTDAGTSGIDRPPGFDPVLGLVTAVGSALNRSSFPVTRIQEILGEIAEANGTHIRPAVFPTLVLGMSETTGAMLLERTEETFRFDQISDVQTQLRRAREGSAPAEHILQRLNEIPNKPPPNPWWLRIVGYSMLAVGFAGLFRLSLTALAFAALLGAAVGGCLILTAGRSAVSSLMPVAATFGSALVVSLAASVWHMGDPVLLAVVPVLVLIPGAALTASVMELAGGDMIAGSARLTYALMILVSMAFGFAVAFSLFELPASSLQDLTTARTPPWAPWAGAAVFAIGAVLYFCTPRQLLGWAIALPILAFAASDLLRLVLAPELASGVAAALALLFALAINARAGGGPSVIVLFLPAFWLLVPGSLVFVAFTGVLTDNRSLVDIGRSAGLSILSIAVGIMVAGLAGPVLGRRLFAGAES